MSVSKRTIVDGVVASVGGGGDVFVVGVTVGVVVVAVVGGGGVTNGGWGDDGDDVFGNCNSATSKLFEVSVGLETGLAI